ncbi:hypothetical protein [Sphingomonas hengshuiensis]|uniref:Uncharacterized protein n=1 Tax=Sphingomonas hengshuiensis TaxID=1609977 RepID=A0A7U4JAE1_9SPHN|nr:hypothetical protein [Sphingomonas hengshuiensis]AJP73171.1 hypothetical protein TS85_17315 [Sphingomonas hengshuiensis]
MSAKGFKRHTLDPVQGGTILRGLGYALKHGDPVEASATRDRKGRWRRVHARWQDGWRCTLVLHTDGTVSFSMTLKIRTTDTTVAAA